MGWVLRLAVAGAVGLSFGCAKDQPPPPSPVKDGLEELGEVYQFFAANGIPAPSKAADFDAYEPSMQTAYARIQSGEYVVFYGAGYSASSSEVLAYETAAPTAGGKVLLRNGTVKPLTADEFRAAPKAR